jgi:hypothetical protein
MVVTFGETWYNHFEQAYNEAQLPNEITKKGTWTERTLSILERMGKNLGYSVSKEKPHRMDMSWFDKKHFEPQVAIEYETEKTGILDSEILNLAASSAYLKVLITYIEEKEIDQFLKEITNRWQTRSKRTWNDELLMIFCIYTVERGKRLFQYYIGYLLYFSKGNLQTKELKQILC